MTSPSTDSSPFRKLALAIGFLVLGGSALVARSTPATGYELSIYTMTPRLVWAGLVAALSISLAVTFVPFSATERDRPGRSLALVLGGLVFAVFAGMPIVRGYRFYGHYDALTHLGWARGISEGAFLPFDLFYPGIHTLTVLITATIGTSLSRSMLVVVFVATLLFCLFVPLCVGTIVPDRRATAIAVFAAFLLLPITTISMYLSAHAMSQAVLFSSVVVFLFVKYLRTDGSGVVSAVGLTLALALVATVLYHPQLAAHIIVVLLGLCGVQFLARRVASGGRIAGQTPVYGQTVLLIVVFLLWSSNFGFFTGSIAYYLGAAIEFVLGAGGTAGSAVGTQGSSLSAVGGSLTEIFFKLFFPQLVFSLLAFGFAVSVVLLGRPRWLESVRAETTYGAVALVVLGPVFLAYFFAAGSEMYFRVFGLMMVFVTILGALAMYGLGAGLLRRYPQGGSRRIVSLMVAVVVALLLVVSLVAVFPSPYTYQASPHVSDAMVNGYETAFDNTNDETELLGIRDSSNRYDDAIHGNEDRSWRHGDVPPAAFSDGLTNEYEEPGYVALTQADYEREVIAYQGLRYTASDFASLETEIGVHRVQSNGEFDLYYLTPE